jgi:heme exporter protein C
MATTFSLHRFANPARFMRLTDAVLPWLSAAAVASLAIGLVMAFRAPPDYQQGETVRIMFIHVPAAWIGMMCYACMALASAVALIWRHPLADVAAQAAAPLGAGFTLICLVTGSLWGAPMWGTWWVWDARLTSVLILFFLYLGYIALANAFDDPERGARAAAILSLVGAINLPIIRFSVVWWNTLHQPASVLRMGGPAIDPAILDPLLVMALAFQFIFLALWILRTRTALVRAKIDTLRKRAAAASGADRA